MVNVRYKVRYRLLLHDKIRHISPSHLRNVFIALLKCTKHSHLPIQRQHRRENKPLESMIAN